MRIKYFVLIAAAFGLCSFSECSVPTLETSNPHGSETEHRSCRVVIDLRDATHWESIVTSKRVEGGATEYKLVKACKKIPESVLNQSCPQGVHEEGTGNIITNRRYLPLDNQNFQILDERCWKNCSYGSVFRRSCEYKYPTKCQTIKKLGDDPCSVFE